MRQVVWHMIADAILPERGSPLFRLETRLTNALLEERVPHWEAKAAHLQPATKSTTKPKGVEPGSAESEPSLAIKEGIVDEQLGDQPNGDPAVPPTSDAVGRPGDAGAAQQTPPEVSPLATQADSMTDNYTIPDVKSERRALRDAYKGECRKHGVQVTDAMIAEVASGNWHGRTAIQKWLGCDPRYDGPTHFLHFSSLIPAVRDAISCQQVGSNEEQCRDLLEEQGGSGEIPRGLRRID